MRIRNRVLAAVGLLAVGTMPLVAQGSPRVGPVAGINFASVGGEDVDETKSRTTFMAGLFAEIPVSNVFSVQPEALYTMKGPNLTDPDGSIRFAYLEVPVLLRVNIPTGGSMNGSGSGVRPHLYAGPAVAFKMSCSLHESGASSNPDCDDPSVDFVEFKSTDLGAVFGGGVDIGDFTVGARFTLGLTNIIDSSDPSEDAKHRVLSAYAAYGFRLR